MGSIALAAAWLLATTTAQTEPPRGDTTLVDYRLSSSWLCRPGEDGLCSSSLDAVSVDVSGARSPAPYVAAQSPKVDCFYVYPTLSGDSTLFSGLQADATVQAVVRSQAARLGAVCRLFIPSYHQLTQAGLKWMIAQGAEKSTAVRDTTIAMMDDVPLRDVRSAWRYYLNHDNHGRGVVLIGHSQGAIILKALLAEDVDGTPIRKRLVAAYLVGNPDLGTGDLHGVPLCRQGDQTGCLVAWSSYAAGYDGPRFFGAAKRGTPVCVNPAALAGGTGLLKSFLYKPPQSPASDPPFVEWRGRISARCTLDAEGAVLRESATPGQASQEVEETLDKISQQVPTYGLHFEDLELAQGTVLKLIARQASSYSGDHPPRLSGASQIR